MTDLWMSLLPIAAATTVVPGRFIAMILLFHTEMALLTPPSWLGEIVSFAPSCLPSCCSL